MGEFANQIRPNYFSISPILLRNFAQFAFLNFLFQRVRAILNFSHLFLLSV